MPALIQQFAQLCQLCRHIQLVTYSCRICGIYQCPLRAVQRYTFSTAALLTAARAHAVLELAVILCRRHMFVAYALSPAPGRDAASRPH